MLSSRWLLVRKLNATAVIQGIIYKLIMGQENVRGVASLFLDRQYKIGTLVNSIAV